MWTEGQAHRTALDKIISIGHAWCLVFENNTGKRILEGDFHWGKSAFQALGANMGNPHAAARAWTSDTRPAQELAGLQPLWILPWKDGGGVGGGSGAQTLFSG